MLTIELDGKQVQIAARHSWDADGSEELDATCDLLLTLILYLNEEARSYEAQELHYLAKRAREEAKGLRRVLAENDFYSDSEVEALQAIGAI